ncbi:MAG: hypothetical protein EXR69_03220 [Myxococcales bacterium]|nr:hypothetical protein [Myxococcales bacterium]
MCATLLAGGIAAGATGQAADLPGWIEVGPERGHVMDIALSGESVLALTRVGVLATDLSLSRWRRDARFPAALKLLAAEPGSAVWGVSRAGIWRVDSSARLVAPLPGAAGGRTAVVDVVSPAVGVVVVALRGDDPGVWRVESGASGGDAAVLVRTVSGIDPWQMAVDGATIWLGTLDKGLMVSRDGGKSFASVPGGDEGAVSAVAVIDGSVWTGWSDGRVTTGPDGRVTTGPDAGPSAPRLVCTVRVGPPIAMAKVGERVLTVVDAATGPLSDLYECPTVGPPGDAVMVPSPRVDDDPTPLQPTGLWALDAARAILGTFRSGPLLVDATGLQTARAGFHATLGEAAKPGPDGRLGVVLMSTGVYESRDGTETWTPIAARASEPHSATRRRWTLSPIWWSWMPRRAQIGPVTDATDLHYAADRVTVVDFEGVTIGKRDQWSRTNGVYTAGGGRKNGLLEISDDAEGQLWGRDFDGNLWEQDGEIWTRCATGDVLRLDGEGDHLVVVTATSLLSVADCAAAGTPVWPDLPTSVTSGPAATRSDGHWLAAPGGLWRDGEAVATLPNEAVQALSVLEGAAEDGSATVHVALSSGAVLSCATGTCVEATKRLPGPVRAIGQLSSGSGRGGLLWALEERGSILLSHPGGTPGPVVDHLVVEADLGGPTRGANLGGETVEEQHRIPPWRSVGRPDFDKQIPLGSRVLPSESLADAVNVIGGAGGDIPAWMLETPLGRATGALGLPPFSDTWFWAIVEGGVLMALGIGVVRTVAGGRRGADRRNRRRGR